MKYWIIYIILAGLMVSIWVPKFAADSATDKVLMSSEPELVERRLEIPTDSLGIIYPEHLEVFPTEPSPSPPSNNEVVSEAPVTDWAQIQSSILFLVGMVNFYWQIKDRRTKRNNKPLP